MKKEDKALAGLQPGMICAFFEQNNLQFGLLLSVEGTACRIYSLTEAELTLPTERIVLFSQKIYPLNEPQNLLTEFQKEVQNCLNDLDLSSLRNRLLQEQQDLTLEQIIEVCELPSTDAFRFALYQAVRNRPDYFKRKHPFYHVLTPEEEQLWQKDAAKKERQRQDALIFPLLARKGLPVSFSPEELAAADKLLPVDRDVFRLELIDEEIWTIDASDSRDLDDALSLEEMDEGWQLGIHISDVSSLISKDSVLDLAARERVSSVYLPNGNVYLLPESIVCEKASLLTGELRLALSLLLTVNSDWQIVSFLFFPSVICVKRNFTYEEFTSFLEPDVFTAANKMREKALILQKITERHRQYRLEQGALGTDDCNLPPVRRLVAECMIIYNRYLTDLIKDFEVPLIYRSLQEKNPAKINSLPPSIWGTVPKKHIGLGLPAYAQFTSPLRRYPDLINQRQFSAFNTGKDLPHSQEELTAWAESMNRKRNLLKQLMQQAENQEFQTAKRMPSD